MLDSLFRRRDKHLVNKKANSLFPDKHAKMLCCGWKLRRNIHNNVLLGAMGQDFVIGSPTIQSGMVQRDFVWSLPLAK